MTDRRGRIGGTRRIARAIALLACLCGAPQSAAAQALTQRGFLDGTVMLFPQEAVNDPVQVVGDFLAREEIFFKPAPWVQFAGGLDLRANSHDQVDDSWALDVSDRTVRRPRLSLRRLTATFTHGPFTVDVGKQFIRWGKTDIVTPTDRFAPRDFMNVVAADYLAVSGVRAVAQHGSETFEAVVTRFTPSRTPLLDQRWTVVPSAAASVPLVDAGSAFPDGSQTGLRWGHVGAGYEFSLSFFNGFNTLPNIGQVGPTGQVGQVEPVGPVGQVGQVGTTGTAGAPPFVAVQRSYPAIRTYGGDVAVPTPWFTIKGEAAYFTSTTPLTDEYVLYVIQLERQTGEWVLVAGYAGEAVTAQRSALSFAPDRGLTRSIVGRASYTIDPLRSLAFETAVHQNGDGIYGKIEYSQTRGQHWRATLTAVGLGGKSDDFLGQYQRNSHVQASLRYSF